MIEEQTLKSEYLQLINLSYGEHSNEEIPIFINLM